MSTTTSSKAAVFALLAQNLQERKATNEEWRSLRTRMEAYAYVHIPQYLWVDFAEARAIAAALGFGRKRGHHVLLNFTPDRVEATLWRMAWLSLTNRIYACTDVASAYAVKSLTNYLTNAYHISILK